MAVRSGAGTGVVVSLVVFVLTTVFLLVMTIVFYSGQSKALQRESDAESTLARYVKPAQRNQDLFTSLEAAAQSSNQSVSEYMHGRFRSLMALADGNSNETLESFNAKATRLGAGDQNSLLAVAERLNGQVGRRQTEIDSLNSRLSDREQEIAELNAQIQQQDKNHRDELDDIKAEIDQYRMAVEEYRQQLTETITQVNASAERLRETKDRTIAGLEDDKDDLLREVNVLRGRITEFQSILDEIRLKAERPDLLVDGEVIDVAASDQVFINRGRQHRIVLGMTFEIYDDKSSLSVDPRTGMMPRGKASVQVVKVGETTSTCKLTRATPGRPVVRNDVIANAVYDPTYNFKFLIHGKFDIDGDRRPSEAEAEYLRSLVIDWGGSVVTGEELPGDLDFLVLGEEPPMPPPLRDDASEIEIRTHIRKKAARENYQELFRRASEAQIPILNANRFLILIGYTER